MKYCCDWQTSNVILSWQNKQKDIVTILLILVLSEYYRRIYVFMYLASIAEQCLLNVAFIMYDIKPEFASLSFAVHVRYLCNMTCSKPNRAWTYCLHDIDWYCCVIKFFNLPISNPNNRLTKFPEKKQLCPAHCFPSQISNCILNHASDTKQKHKSYTQSLHSLQLIRYPPYEPINNHSPFEIIQSVNIITSTIATHWHNKRCQNHHHHRKWIPIQHQS